ncbi:MAG: NAD(+) synthase [Eubacteriales bacterium]|nr:NAD(+) synthase [Eubacteriales bacterium]
MKDGFIKVAACTPNVRVADCEYNADEIIRMAHEAGAQGARVIVMPELCITSYTCGDLFWQELLLDEAKAQLLRIAKETADVDAILFVGLPLEYKGKLYNVAAGISHGEILGIVPKIYLPNYNEFYEARYFTSGAGVDGTVTLKQQPEVEEPDLVTADGPIVEFGFGDFDEELEEEEIFEDGEEEEEEPEDEDEFLNCEVSISPYMMFTCSRMPKLKIAVEICEDLWAPNPPSVGHAYHGANLIVNLSASDEVVGKDSYRRSLVSSQSARLICGYIYATAGEGESTQDVVYGGQNLIAENGTILAESRRFVNGITYGDLDIQRLVNERRRMTTYQFSSDKEEGDEEPFYEEMFFDLEVEETKLSREFDSRPFVPGVKEERDRRCDEILNIQAMGLKKRLAHIRCQNAVIGLSGGLDSTLALLVTVRAFDMLGMDRKKITAVTMPCFGTTDRTYNNACILSERLGTTLKEVNIKEAVNIHFRDIGHDPEKHDVTYENGQARERTQILMDIANQSGGIVIGTGDLSELALGWATYNGDHMSMYAVNCSVPKTLVRHLVQYFADTCGDGKLSEVLLDILDTPVSPELLPPKDGVISQKTEDLVGPYELHDFFLYYMLRWTFPPKKIYRMAQIAFAGEYDNETILKWIKIFYRRFFQQQFKRSCLPDGPKVGSVAVSPRGDLRMPSDACAKHWLNQVEGLE